MVREMLEQFEQILAELKVADAAADLLKTPVGLALLNAANDVQIKKDRLVTLGEQVTSTVERVTKSMATSVLPTVSSRGELQSAAGAYDAACAELAAAIDHAKVLADLYNASR